MSDTTDTKWPYIRRAKIQRVFKILKKKKKNGKRLHVRDDGVFGCKLMPLCKLPQLCGLCLEVGSSCQFGIQVIPFVLS